RVGAWLCLPKPLSNRPCRSFGTGGWIVLVGACCWILAETVTAPDERLLACRRIVSDGSRSRRPSRSCGYKIAIRLSKISIATRQRQVDDRPPLPIKSILLNSLV